MAHGSISLRIPRHGDRRAHFHAHGLCQILNAFFGDGFQPVKKCQTVRLAGLRKALECGFGGGHRLVHIGGVSHRNRADLCFSCRIQDWHSRVRGRWNPLPADIEFQKIIH